jgi:hypothetical protein
MSALFCPAWIESGRSRAKTVLLGLLAFVPIIEGDLLPTPDALHGVDGDVLIAADGHGAAAAVGLLGMIGETGQIALKVGVDLLTRMGWVRRCKGSWQWVWAGGSWAQQACAHAVAGSGETA